MGWTPGRVLLSWEDGHPLHGLEISLRRRSMREVLESWERIEAKRAEAPPELGELPEPSLAERAENVRSSAAELAALMVGWNAEDDDGQPLAPTVDAVLGRLGWADVITILEAYADATTRVSPPLPSRSVDGQRSADEDLILPTAPL